MLIVIGLALYIIGVIPRRRGDVPFCRKCKYNLTGSTSQHCPECGRQINAKSVVFGERYTRRGLTYASLLFYLPAYVQFLAMVPSLSYYQLLSTEWLIDAAQSDDATIHRPAWNELQRRITAQDLTGEEFQELIDVSLAAHAKFAPDADLPQQTFEYIKLLGTAYSGNHLTDEQIDALCDNMVYMELNVRPTVLAGESVPAELKLQYYSLPAPWWIRIERVNIVSGGQMRSDYSRYAPHRIPLSRFGSFTHQLDFDQYAIGQHQLSVNATVAVYVGQSGNKAKSKLKREYDFQMRADYEVVESLPPNQFIVSREKETGDDLRDAIWLSDFRLRNGQVHGTINYENLPVDVAFDVYSRVIGDTTQVESLLIRRQRWKSRYRVRWPHNGPTFDTLDLMLRSDVTRARQTVDIFETWEGDIVFEDVPVVVED